MAKRKSRKSAPHTESAATTSWSERGARKRKSSPHRPADDIWLYGRHAALAAIANDSRVVRRVLVTKNMAEDCLRRLPRELTEIVDRETISAVLNPGEVHQGIAVLAAPLPGLGLEDICDATGNRSSACVVVLDQANDPRNVGAVIRSAAALGATAVIVQDRHAPPARGALAKAASGALERLPLVRVGNLARALDGLKQAGFWCMGFDGDAPESLVESDMPAKVALVFGAEGRGLRRLTGETCDLVVGIPITASVASLNLANAATIGLYEWRRRHGDGVG